MLNQEFLREITAKYKIKNKTLAEKLGIQNSMVSYYKNEKNPSISLERVTELLKVLKELTKEEITLDQLIKY